MRTHRFCCPDAIRDGDQVRIEGPAAAQIRRVLRLAPGDQVILFGTDEWEYAVALEELLPRMVTGRIVGRAAPQSEPDAKLILAFALLKGEKTEWVLQKGTELGATGFLLIRTERTVVSPDERRSRARLERYARILCEATEQCGRLRPPSIEGVMTFSRALAATASHAAFLLHPSAPRRLSAHLQSDGSSSSADPSSRAENTLPSLKSPPPNGSTPSLDPRPVAIESLGSPLALFIGPEGGFTEDEVRQAVACGVQPASLGARILRAETAALAAVTLVMDHLETRQSSGETSASTRS